MALTRAQFITLGAATAAATLTGRRPRAADAKHYSFGYDQPHTTAYGIGADLFANKLAELSKGTHDHRPVPRRAARPGTADAAENPHRRHRLHVQRLGQRRDHLAAVGRAVDPFLFPSEAHLVKAVATPALVDAIRAMFADTVKDAHCLTLLTLGLRNLYGKKEIHSIADIKNLKVRVQATPTEDTMFPAYGAQIVHMPFGSVYTSLQTGVVDMAENGVNVYDSNKHYEVAPIMSMTEHEANCNLLWSATRYGAVLSPEQKGWVTRRPPRSPPRSRRRRSSWSTSRGPNWRRWA